MTRADEISAKLPLGSAVAAGSVRVAVLETVAALSALHHTDADTALVTSGCITHATDLFFALPWHNIIHGIVAGMFRSALQATPQGPLSVALVGSAVQLPARLTAAFRRNDEASAGHAGRRLGYMGHCVDLVLSLEQAATTAADGAIAAALKVINLFRCFLSF